jgi:PAS domain S-box-containing protein
MFGLRLFYWPIHPQEKGNREMKGRLAPSGMERALREDDFIVSKTDRKGIITYGNRTFIEFSGYSEEELLGKPHNIIRHPDMPRAIFRVMWRTLREGREFFGYIKNKSKNGDFYWTFANVTPKLSPQGELLDFFSVRRKPLSDKLPRIEAIYHDMLAAEQRAAGAKEAMDAGEAVLMRAMEGKDYHAFVLTL